MFLKMVVGNKVGDWGTMEIKVRRVGRWRVAMGK